MADVQAHEAMARSAAAFEAAIDELAWHCAAGKIMPGTDAVSAGGAGRASDLVGSIAALARPPEWAAVCDAACSALAAFPTGCTRAVLVAEVASAVHGECERVMIGRTCIALCLPERRVVACHVATSG